MGTFIIINMYCYKTINVVSQLSLRIMCFVTLPGTNCLLLWKLWSSPLRVILWYYLCRFSGGGSMFNWLPDFAFRLALNLVTAYYFGYVVHFPLGPMLFYHVKIDKSMIFNLSSFNIFVMPNTHHVIYAGLTLVPAVKPLLIYFCVSLMLYFLHWYFSCPFVDLSTSLYGSHCFYYTITRGFHSYTQWLFELS